MIVISAGLFPILVFVEWWRLDHFAGPGFMWNRVTLPFGVLAVSGLIVGWLTNQPTREAGRADARADEAEALRDQLGRRSTRSRRPNRCARTLASSLDVSQAFAFAPEEVELVALLGRLVATAAQNIRAHEAEDETSRLPSLVADVLHTSRIEAGTFTFVRDVDLAQRLRDVASRGGPGSGRGARPDRGERDAAACGAATVSGFARSRA